MDTVSRDPLPPPPGLSFRGALGIAFLDPWVCIRAKLVEATQESSSAQGATHTIAGKPAGRGQLTCPEPLYSSCVPPGIALQPRAQGFASHSAAYLHRVISVGEDVQQVSRGDKVEPWESQSLRLQIFRQCLFTHSQAEREEGEGTGWSFFCRALGQPILSAS